MRVKFLMLMDKYLITPIREHQEASMKDIYQLLLKRGLTTSQRDFSTHYAGKSPSYLATTQSLSEGAMVAVFRKLMEEGRWLLAWRVARIILFGQRDNEVAA